MNLLRTGTALLVATVAVSAATLAVDSARDRAYAAEPTSVVPALAEPPAANDPTPGLEPADLAHLDLTEEAMRHLTDAAGMRAWAATSTDEEVCVVVEDLDTAGRAGSACREVTDFFQSGVSLRLEDGDGDGVLVHLLPPDVTPTAAQRGIDEAAVGAQATTGDDLVPPAAGGTAVVAMSVEEADMLGELRIPRAGGELVLRTLEPSEPL